MSLLSPNVRKHMPIVVLYALLALLTIKFFLPFFRFPISLGYDPGIYRFLFLKYAGSFPLLPDLPHWAGEHPPGLFLLAAPLLRFGVPVDWFLGWIWNFMPIILALALALEFRAREGAVVGTLVLLSAVLSLAYYDGFVGMYWKTYVALLFMVFAFGALERSSKLAPLYVFLALIVHHQTGLLLGLTLVTWSLLRLRHRWNDPRLWATGVLLAGVALLSLAFYAPHWTSAVRDPFTSIYRLRGDFAPGGSFPDPSFYVRTEAILLALGAWGFLLSLRKEKGSLWQIAVLWTLPFILFRLVFYRRFFLQCDFFLLPYCAIGIADLWQRFSLVAFRIALVALIAVQGMISLRIAWDRIPVISMDTYWAIQSSSREVLQGSSPIIALDNAAAPWLLGWLTDREVGGPGIFDVPGWTKEQWENFLYGSQDVRAALLGTLPQGTLFVLTPLFTDYYGVYVEGFLGDPCLVQRGEWVMESVCGS
jgi:hypothetical protein